MNNQIKPGVYVSVEIKSGNTVKHIWSEFTKRQYQAHADFKRNHEETMYSMGHCLNFYENIGISDDGTKYKYWVGIFSKTNYIQLGDGKFHEILEIHPPTDSKDNSFFENQ